MKCAKARKHISDYIDGDLDAGKVSSLERHLDACPDCRKLLEDFQNIKQKAKNLAKAEPSDQLWFRVKSALEAKTQYRETPLRARFLFFPARLRYAVSAALLMFVVVGSVVIGLRVWHRSGVSEVSGQALALAKIQEAEQYYKLAIKSLWEAVQAQEGSIDPQVAKTFRVNLELIDSSLADCRRVVENNPADVESRYYLLAVYKKKTELLESMMEVSLAAPQAKESETIY
jgi:anti-sigma factor RsiW